MKKLLATALVVVMAAATLCGCGSSETTTTSTEGTTEETKTGVVKVIDVDLTTEEYAFGVDKNQPELLQASNEFIKEIKENGKLEEICNKYFADGEPTAVKSAELDSSKDQLVVATNAAFEPFEYTKGDSYYGIDMEVAALLAEKLGKELVIQNMKFDAVCLSVGQHKCDIAMSGLTVKEDRKQYVDFADSYYQASQRLIVKSDDTEFDACKDAASVEAILKTKDKSVNIGVQNGTTGQFYCEGDKDWGFDGYNVTTKGYENGSLAVQDLINGNLNYVIIDSEPANCITRAINKVQ
ncbi:MAG: transporter substrate-binding domain-containing protein [Lachnospiraceae bacterium]|nr:transporter substrate-binding domain-containing protein [Lachnospiraceae bacterium]